MEKVKKVSACYPSRLRIFWPHDHSYCFSSIILFILQYTCLLFLSVTSQLPSHGIENVKQLLVWGYLTKGSLECSATLNLFVLHSQLCWDNKSTISQRAIVQFYLWWVVCFSCLPTHHSIFFFFISKVTITLLVLNFIQVDYNFNLNCHWANVPKWLFHESTSENVIIATV